LFTAPVVLVPLAGGPKALILAMLFTADFVSGFGAMVLDISVGSIFGAVIPDDVRSRVSGAFQAVNYGTRPVGALLGGALGTLIGLRPALWVAAVGGIVGVPGTPAVARAPPTRCLPPQTRSLRTLAQAPAGRCNLAAIERVNTRRKSGVGTVTREWFRWRDCDGWPSAP
jgi:MFS family permease